MEPRTRAPGYSRVVSTQAQLSATGNSKSMSIEFQCELDDRVLQKDNRTRGQHRNASTNKKAPPAVGTPEVASATHSKPLYLGQAIVNGQDECAHSAKRRQLTGLRPGAFRPGIGLILPMRIVWSSVRHRPRRFSIS